MKALLLLALVGMDIPAITVDFGTYKQHGMGVVIDAETVLTNAHVVGSADTATVEIGGETSKGEVVARDRTFDVAAIRIPNGKRTTHNVGSVSVGSRVFAIGREGRRLSGVVVGYASPQPRADQHWANVSGTQAISGDSGGPVFDDEGKLVGLIRTAGDGNGQFGIVAGERLAMFVASIKDDPGPAPKTPTGKIFTRKGCPDNCQCISCDCDGCDCGIERRTIEVEATQQPTPANPATRPAQQWWSFPRPVRSVLRWR